MSSALVVTALGLLACRTPDDPPVQKPNDPIQGETPMTETVLTETVQPLSLTDSGLPVPVERPLTGAETHAYTLTLAAGSYLHVSVDQRGIDVEVRLFAPDAELLTVIDSPTGAHGAEVLTIVTQTAGEHRLEVSAYSGQAPGRYELRLEELRDATDDDRARTAPVLAFHAGERLRRQRTAESRRQALVKYQEALDAWRALEDRTQEAQALYRIGWVHRDLGELEEAGDAYREARRLFHELGERQEEAVMANRLGAVEMGLDELDAAEETFEQALLLLDELERPDVKVSVLFNAGNLHLRRNDAQKALDAYRAALDEARNLDDATAREPREARAHHNVGTVLLYQGRAEDALDELRQALALRRKLGHPGNLASTLIRLGDAYQRLNQPDEALEPLREALALRREGGDARRLAVSLASLGNLHLKTGHLDEAGELYEEALALAREKGRRHDEAVHRVNLGEHRKASGDAAGALALFDEALALFQLTGDRRGEAYARYASAGVLHDQKAYTAACAHLDDAVTIVEELRPRLVEEDLRMAFFATRQGYYELLIDVLAHLAEQVPEPAAGYAAAALEANERRRARVLVETLSTAETDPEPLTARQIPRLLERDSLLLVYSLGEERSFLWTVSRQGPLRSHVLAGRGEIERLALSVYRSWSRTPLASGAPGGDAAERLADALLAPAVEELGTKRLVVVADGALQYLPFAALPDPASPGEPLIGVHEVVYLPSATVLATLRRRVFDREPAPLDVALIADPVFHRDDPRVVGSGVAPSPQASEEPGALTRAAADMGLEGFERLEGTRAEAEAVAALIPEDLRLDAFGFDASRATVLDGGLDRYKVLHFATHGLLNNRRPELSGLVLSLVDEAGNAQDGFLRLHEIYDLDLPAELVVLSACQTGLGAELAGEGLIALPRGFLHAGAPRVVVSLWKVDDESTAELMRRFYTGLFEEGLSPAAALRAAQLSLRQEERWQHPYHWAPFVSQGEWRLEPPRPGDDDIEPPDGGGEDAEPIDSDIGGGGGEPREVSSGLNGATGDYLPPPPSYDEIVESVGELVLHPATARERRWIAESRADEDERLPVYGTDPRDLSSAGWGVVFAPGVGEDVREALKPLLDRRREEAGSLFKVYDYPPGTSKDDFLAAYGAGFGPVNPEKVPYYVLLVGDPRALPFRFQYELDMQHAVGRLHFDSAEEYARYAEGVLQAEDDTVERPREMAFFAAENPDDVATRRMCRELIEPLAAAVAREGWKQKLVLGEDATKERLGNLLGGAETPALLFTATHGMGFPYPHKRLRSDQGALLCQDWRGPEAEPGPVSPDRYFAAADLGEEADIRGLVAFHFACYSAGTPREDSYYRAGLGRPERIAEHPFVSRLGQRLLGHPRGGALAVLGHVDRAWTTSFSWTRGETGEIEVFESTLKPLLDGHRIGFATEYFNQRYAGVSVVLSNLLEDRDRRLSPERSRVERIYRANNDARNFVLLGDPAIRLLTSGQNTVPSGGARGGDTVG